jgi:hypothetical protein
VGRLYSPRGGPVGDVLEVVCGGEVGDVGWDKVDAYARMIMSTAENAIEVNAPSGSS